MPNNDTTAIDHVAFNRLKEDMGEDFDELIPIFIKSGQEILSALEQAFSGGDIEAFSRHAHSLKSCSANLGGHQLSAQAANLEAQANAGNMPDSADFIQPLKSEFMQIETELSILAA